MRGLDAPHPALADEIEDYNRRPANCGFWRVALRVRVSTHRLRALMHATLPRVQDRELPPAPYKDYPRPVSKLPDHQPTGRAGAARRLAPLPLP